MIRQKIKKAGLLFVFVFCAWSGYAQVPSKPVDAFTLRAGYNHNRDKNTAFLGGGYLLSIASVTAGYSIPFGREPFFKGFTLGVQFQLPVIDRR